MWHGSLDNGMRVVLLPDDGPDVAAAYLWLNVGSADEPEGLAGAAHLIEHMVFKGTARFGVGECAAAIEGMGGDLNAWTSHDETVFHATVPGAHAAAAVDVLAEMMRHARFAADELERERKVVLEEIRGGEDEVGQVVGEALAAAAWPDHPYGRPVIGTAASVRQLPRDQLLAFYARHYVPSNACLAVAGRFDAEALRAALPARFGGGPPAPGRRRAGEARVTGGVQRRLRRRFDTHVVQLGFGAPAIAHVDAPTWEVLATAVGGSSAAPLIATLRVLPGCLDVRADYDGEAQGGLFVVDAHVTPGAGGRVLDAASDVLATAASGGLHRGDIARARAGLAAERRFGRQTADGRAHAACYYREHFGHADAWRAYDTRIAAVTDAAVHEAAKALAPAHAVTLTLGSAGRAAPSWRPSARVAPPPEVRRHVLPGGMRVLLEPDEGAIAAVRIVGIGGQVAETRALAGRSGMWMRTVARGAAGVSADALGRSLGQLGGSIGATGGRSSQALRADLPAEGFAAGFELLLHTLLAPTFAEPELDQARASMLDDLAARDDDPADRLDLAVWAAAFPGHAWGLDPSGTSSSLPRIGPATLARAHRAWASAPNLVVAITGEFDADYALGRLRHAERHLGAAPPPPPRRPAAVPRRRLNLRSARDQAHLAFAWEGLTVGHPDVPALDVLVELLSGQAGRLFLELREAEGLAYAVGAHSLDGLVAGLVTANVATDPARADEAERRLLDCVQGVASGRVTEAEVARARAALLGASEAELQTVGARATEAAFSELYGLDGTAYRAVLRRTDAVTREDVVGIAARLLGVPRIVGRLGPG
jgi:zinc protease